MEVGKIAWEEALDEVRDRAINYSLMTSEEEVLIEVEFFLENFHVEAEDDLDIHAFVKEAESKGAQYLMLTP